MRPAEFSDRVRALRRAETVTGAIMLLFVVLAVALMDAVPRELASIALWFSSGVALGLGIGSYRRRLMTRLGLVCPECKKSLATHVAVTVTTGKCGACGFEVLA